MGSAPDWRPDPHRPRFHFTAPSGWLNDPNGLGRWGDTYHLFYQHNPDAPVHGAICWGHATSQDLLHWTDRPIALAPSDDGPDADGCWSGVLVDDDGTPTIVYSGNRADRQRACLAVGDADLLEWSKVPANPVIPEPPDGLDLVAYRDHCVWREGDRWHQLIGAGIRGEGGTALHYSSADLRTWDWHGPLLVGDASVREPIWTGTMWECVDLFGLRDRHLLVFSVWDDDRTLYPAYHTGHYTGDAFVPNAVGMLDYGRRYFYAPQSMADVCGRRTMFGWMQEGRPQVAIDEDGWAGVMSLPRQVWLGADGLPAMAPIEEVASLRAERLDLPRTTRLSPGRPVGLEPPTGDRLDIEASLTLDANATAEIAVRCTSDDAERTAIVLDRPRGELRLDRRHSSLDPGVDAIALQGPIPIGPDGKVDLRVIVDHSAIEIFAAGRALSARIYPTRPDAAGIRISAIGGDVGLDRLEAWTMAETMSR